MNGKHFHEEWSFVFTWFRQGKVKKTRRITESRSKPFLSETEARQEMDEMMQNASAYIQTHGVDGEFDAVEVIAPVRRIVTEWEDREEETK
mgnify:CR=1 FL=1